MIGWFRERFAQRRWQQSCRALGLDGRLVVFDLETTGLDVARDRPLSIGAVAINRRQIDIDDAYAAALRSDVAPQPDNILVHRLTPRQLEQASAPGDAIQAFLDYVGDAPLFAYHADFDRAILSRAARRELGSTACPLCIDVAHWVMWATPVFGRKPPPLDAALAYFRIPPAQRHDALGDALATARLVQVLLSLPPSREIDSIGSLVQTLRRSQVLHGWRD